MSRKFLAIAPLTLALCLGALAWVMFRKKVAPEEVAPPPAAAPVAEASASLAAAIPMRAILVTSKPSGATIWINSSNTGMVTPSNVNVPDNGKFILMLQKRGYAPYIEDKPLQSLAGRKFFAVMARSKVNKSKRH